MIKRHDHDWVENDLWDHEPYKGARMGLGYTGKARHRYCRNCDAVEDSVRMGGKWRQIDPTLLDWVSHTGTAPPSRDILGTIGSIEKTIGMR
ncbi:MAG: hypothetical protein MPK62_00315 [Alphaproteobacteria bacterium]|nr:hypothetical protein [Alphaproteobacteria bacterium]